MAGNGRWRVLLRLVTAILVTVATKVDLGTSYESVQSATRPFFTWELHCALTRMTDRTRFTAEFDRLENKSFFTFCT